MPQVAPSWKPDARGKATLMPAPLSVRMLQVSTAP